MSKILDDAIIFATIKHSDQLRKGHHIPYIVHPMEVANIISSIVEDDQIMAAGILHDVMEDCKVTQKELEKRFGVRIVELVCDESEKRIEGEDKVSSWKTRKAETIERIKNCSIESKIICLADKLSNMRSIYNDYTKIGDKTFDIFNNKNKDDIKWYYEGIKQSLKDLSYTNAYKEFTDLINKVFN